MTESKPSFVPISDLTSPRIRVVLPLPNFVDQRQILVNERAVDRLCGIAGIRHLRIVAHEGDETSGFIPTVVGFDASGGAYAGKTGLKTSVPEYFAEQQTEGDRPWYTRQTDGTIAVNINEMASRIGAEKRWSSGVQSPESWAHHLNKIMRGGISEIGLKHLLLDHSKYDLLWMGIIQTGNMLLASPDLIAGKSLEAVSRVVFMNLWMSTIWLPIAGRVTNRYTRMSLIYGPQLDRALLFKIYLATQTLVKASQT